MDIVKRITLPVDITVREYDTQVVLGVDVGADAAHEWTLALTLLHMQLVKSVIVVDQRSQFELRLSLADEPDRPHRARASLTANRCGIEVTGKELEYWLAYFLEFFRDGFATVPSIDVETDTVIDAREFDVVLYAPAVRAPMSGEELRKRLGLRSSASSRASRRRP